MHTYIYIYVCVYIYIYIHIRGQDRDHVGEAVGVSGPRSNGRVSTEVPQHNDNNNDRTTNSNNDMYNTYT